MMFVVIIATNVCLAYDCLFNCLFAVVNVGEVCVMLLIVLFIELILIMLLLSFVVLFGIVCSRLALWCMFITCAVCLYWIAV